MPDTMHLVVKISEAACDDRMYSLTGSCVARSDMIDLKFTCPKPIESCQLNFTSGPAATFRKTESYGWRDMTSQLHQH